MLTVAALAGPSLKTILCLVDSPDGGTGAKLLCTVAVYSEDGEICWLPSKPPLVGPCDVDIGCLDNDDVR